MPTLLEAAKPFCIALYDKLRQTAMESARFTLFAKKNTLKVMAVSPTIANLFQQVFRAYLHVMLWKLSSPHWYINSYYSLLVGMQDVLAERTAAIRKLTHKFLRLEMRRIFKQRIFIDGGDQDSDVDMYDLAIADDLAKW